MQGKNPPQRIHPLPATNENNTSHTFVNERGEKEEETNFNPRGKARLLGESILGRRQVRARLRGNSDSEFPIGGGKRFRWKGACCSRAGRRWLALLARMQQQQLGIGAPIPPPMDAFPAMGSPSGDDDLDETVQMFLQDSLLEIENDTSLTDVQKDAKRKERLERNREIARNCRKRKRERAEALQEEVTRLRETNRQLELKLKMAQNKLGEATSGRGNRGKIDEERRLQEVQGMYKMLEQRCSDEEIMEKLKTYTEVYSDFGEERHKLVKVHVDQLEQLLLPTQVSKMLLWILQQEDEFYTDTDPKSIWSVLCRELELDEVQKASLKAQRSELGAQSASMKKCLHSLNKFAENVEKNMEERSSVFQKIISIIKPSQIIEFLKWIEENQSCVHMLNGLWTINRKRSREIDAEIKSNSAPSSSKVLKTEPPLTST